MNQLRFRNLSGYFVGRCRGEYSHQVSHATGKCEVAFLITGKGKFFSAYLFTSKNLVAAAGGSYYYSSFDVTASWVQNKQVIFMPVRCC